MRAPPSGAVSLDKRITGSDTSRMALKIDLLRVFCTVADTGSLARAAAELGRTPSAVSMALKQLEDHLGAPLFAAARKSQLTPLGAQIHREAQQELAHFERTRLRIEGLARATHGHVRLAVTPSVAQTILPGITRRFHEAYPDVSIELRDLDSASVLDALETDKADIGIATLPNRAGFERFELFSDAFGVVCPRSHPLVEVWDTLTWEDLRSEPLISNGLVDQVSDPAFAQMRAASKLFVRNTGSLFALLRAGAGITLLPRRALGPSEGDLAFLALKDTSARRTVHVMHRGKDAILPPAARFAEMLRTTELQLD